MDKAYPIRKIAMIEVEEALNLAWQVFMDYEGPAYSQEGIAEFKRYLSVDTFCQRLHSGQYQMWCAYAGKRIIGLLATVPPAHISLLFVDPAYHRRGIARALFGRAADHLCREQGNDEITVHSSPYAEPIYRRLGFRPTDSEQVENGIRYIPMVYRKE